MEDQRYTWWYKHHELTMTKAQADRWLHRIYRALRDLDLKVKLNRRLGRIFGKVGESDSDSSRVEMELNPWRPWRTRGGFVPTVLHECLHVADWGKPEWEVRLMEKCMFELLSDRQLTNLMKTVFA